MRVISLSPTKVMADGDAASKMSRRSSEGIRRRDRIRLE